MSVQYGKCNFDGKPVDPEEIDRVRPLLAPYGPDGEGCISKDNYAVFYRAFHTTKGSRLENQPSVAPSGTVITWDGRLDNRSDLIAELRNCELRNAELSHQMSDNPTDLAIVVTAYEQWGTGAFAELIGDWAVSIWNPKDQSLVLAEDFMGTHHLYYSVEKDEVTWCTILDPLVLFVGHPFKLEEEYIAGWLSFFPAPHLTPYVGIHSVPPSSFVRLTRGKQVIRKYWNFDPDKKVRYRTDAEYEEHFRSVFSEAVRRRLRSDSPVLAELSGGIDSSSIVCMADTLLACGLADTPRLDTVSYYNDSEPNWNERPYFTKVEEKRGRTGCHIDVGATQELTADCHHQGFGASPGSLVWCSEAAKQFAECLSSQGVRVVISGIGGDEVAGGIPTPTPELQDLVASMKLATFAHQSKLWALTKRLPLVYLLFEALSEFLPPALSRVPEHRRPAPWLRPEFVKQNRNALSGYTSRVKLFGPLPSFQHSISALNSLQRQLACAPLASTPPYQRRYPYLDRGFLEFIFSVPRQQLVRPGQRRSLMRRAFAGIVPSELLNRKRKAFVARSPMATIARAQQSLVKMSQCMIADRCGIVDAEGFRNTVEKVRNCQEVPIVTLMRTLVLELWLKGLESTSTADQCLPLAEMKRSCVLHKYAIF